MDPVPDVTRSARFLSAEEGARRKRAVAANGRRGGQFTRVQLTGKMEELAERGKEAVATAVAAAFGAQGARDAWVAAASERFAESRAYVDVPTPAVRSRAGRERESGKITVLGEVLEWRAADPRDGPQLGKGEWSMDFEWFFEMSLLGGAAGERATLFVMCKFL